MKALQNIALSISLRNAQHAESLAMRALRLRSLDIAAAAMSEPAT